MKIRVKLNSTVKNNALFTFSENLQDFSPRFQQKRETRKLTHSTVLRIILIGAPCTSAHAH